MSDYTFLPNQSSLAIFNDVFDVTEREKERESHDFITQNSNAVQEHPKGKNSRHCRNSDHGLLAPGS